MVLWIIGLGLGDEKDITLRGLEAVRGCARVYLEAYTSALLIGKDRLEALYGRAVIEADRHAVEQEADVILDGADVDDVAFLVVGDPFGATTHSDLQLRARQRNIPVRVVHNASVLTAVGACGLQLYRFGEAVTVVFFTPTWRPDSFYGRIAANRRAGLHTLVLLDIRVKEPTAEALCRGRRDVFEPPRFMTAAHAAQQLLEVEQRLQGGAYGPDTLVVGLARLGTAEQRIAACTLAELARLDLGAPLHSVVIPGEMHPLEQEVLNTFAVAIGASAPLQPGAPPAEVDPNAATDDNDDK